MFSATPIPGNERAVNETVDHLYKLGCEVITGRDAPVHTSGHGHREEIKLMLNLTRPRYLAPVHGDFKRLHLHAQLGAATGIPAKRIYKLENGVPLDVGPDGARIGERQQAGMVFVDGLELGSDNYETSSTRSSARRRTGVLTGTSATRKSPSVLATPALDARPRASAAQGRPP